MQKISLISLHSVQNYGSALQAFASELYFRKLGYEVETVDYVRQNNLREGILDTALRNSRVWNKNTLTRMIFRMIKSRDLRTRYELFDRFIHQYLTLTPHRYVCDRDFVDHPIEADIYCTGSDQTWNTYWNRGFLAPYYLSFAKPGAKKLAFSASFGKTVLDEEEKPKTRELLSSYDHITVREQSGVEILRDLGIASDRILDPTLLISKEEWLQYLTKPPICEQYILVYQLSHNKTFDRLAKQLAKKTHRRLVRIGLGKEAYLYGGKVILNPDVFTFLSLLAHADAILTDSFHATSFAANLNVKPMIWLPRAFTSRVTDFLAIIGLQDRVFDSEAALARLYDTEVDFAKVNARLSAERERCHAIVERMLRDEV